MPGRRATEACRSRKWSLFCRQFRKIPPGGRRMSRLLRDVHAAITRCPCPATVTPRSRRQQAAGRMTASDTSAPPWRSSRPASSSSSRTTCTAAGELPDKRMRSSIGTGVGPSNSTMRARSPPPGSTAGRGGASGSATAASTGSPRIGRTTVITSAASVTRVAPCLSKSLVPSARGSSGEPGTANTSRPCSSAKRAVISEPDRLAASTTTMPTASPEMSRLRRGKSRARGSQPSPGSRSD